MKDWKMWRLFAKMTPDFIHTILILRQEKKALLMVAL